MRAHIAAILLVSLAMIGGPPLHASIAGAASTNNDAVAVIIGNKDYAGAVPDVDFAHNDAAAMKRFVVEVLGFRDGNVIDFRDATQANLFSTFGNRDDHKGKLWSWVKDGSSDVVVFYSGHGVPGQKDGRGYLLPVNADPDTPEINGYPVDLLYQNLQRIGARSVTVYLDACFSGDSPNGLVTRAASNIGVSHVPSQSGPGITVITAARGDQLASWDAEAGHGLFTAYLLKGLYGAADREGFGNGDGAVTIGEMRSYLDDEMTYAARRRHLREQNATVLGDDGLVLASVPAGGPHEPPSIAAPRAPEFEIVPFLKEMAAVNNAIVRSGPAASYDKLAILAGGESVRVTGRTEDGEWFRLALADGRTGFVRNVALLDPADQPEPRGATAEVRPLNAEAITKIATDVYAGPSTSEDKVARLTAGWKITVTGRTSEGQWFRVALAGGGSGFLPRHVLRRANTARVADAASPQRPAAQSVTRALARAAPLYSRPSLMSSVITRIPAGGRVQIVRRSADRHYVEVRYRGRLGFVLFKDLTKTMR